jgi:TonB family protein
VAAAGLLLMMPRLRHRIGPALRGGPLPVTATLLSLLTHAALGVAIFLAATTWAARQPKMYVVNLVPAVAAVGSPQGRPSLPPRPDDPLRVTPRSPSELPERERPRTSAPREMPERAPALPDRGLPERALPPRPAGTPRASDKELPQVASAPSRAAGPPTSTGRAAEPPASPLGRATGSAQGAGSVTLTASDFPFAWYLAAVQRKITERWDVWAQPGRQPVAVFTIDRDGRVSRLAIEKTSGNGYYDQKALRAINDAVPFPPLPAEWPKPVLTIQLGFEFARDRG